MCSPGRKGRSAAIRPVGSGLRSRITGAVRAAVLAAVAGSGASAAGSATVSAAYRLAVAVAVAGVAEVVPWPDRRRSGHGAAEPRADDRCRAS
ncbi:hypothetical protein [Streptomyces sp. I6]|uniref:hypothetical protein n=1 Tax=Streptomyces sp. I6 TaxID=2483113 RepID=UPI000F451A0C|nr:hypothetical protein [Streptomyces sp. I6]RNL73852.1 hypothetical protein EBF04_29235 [Streptomyces sp. I6]